MAVFEPFNKIICGQNCSSLRWLAS